MAAPCPGERRGRRGRPEESRRVGSRAAKAPCDPERPGLKAPAAAQTARPAQRAPPTGPAPPRPSPEGACTRTSAGASLPFRAASVSPSLRSVDAVASGPWEAGSSFGTHPLPAASAPTNLGLWNPVELSRPPRPQPHFPGPRRACARAPRCGAMRSGWWVPLAGASGEEGGMLRSDCGTKQPRNKPGIEGYVGICRVCLS